MRVELLAVGTELLLGDVVNTNAAWLGRRLAAAGLDVTTAAVVGDNIGRITAAVSGGLERADALVVTGGLGPTQDDLTREALASVAGVALVRDPGLERALRERYAGFGHGVPERNYRQADRPSNADVLANPRGSAPGLCLELPAGVVYALPGVPHEMEAMFTASVLPDLLRRAGKPAVIVSRVLRVAGMWESAVADALAELEAELAAVGNPTIAFLAERGEVRVRVTAKAADDAAAARLIEPVERLARAALGANVYGADEETLASATSRLLLEAGATVAVAESLTGGLLGARLSEDAGSSATFRGGVVAYATGLKADLLGVGAATLDRSGAVSAETAVAMAEGVRHRLGATYGLSLTGVAGPEEQEGAPVGTVYAGLAGPGGSAAVLHRLTGDRARVRVLATLAALDLLRRHLLGEPTG
ncbi:MAG: competence/damage-inducible protein A [Mycobacteriales bacterium]